MREVGKALGLTEDVTAGLASQVWGWSREGVEERHAAELNLDLGDRRLALTLELAKALIDTPRHTSQHPGGFVLTLGRLDELVPIEPAAMVDRQIIEWDKDDIDALGFMKVDVLGLGMLGCMRRAFTLLEEDKGNRRPKLPGKWTDAATGDHGDLLDIIARRESLTLRDTLDEARRFLALPRAEPTDTYLNQLPAPTGSPEAARRLFAMSKPIAGTLAETYLRERGITGARTCTALRFHPRCWHRSDDDPADSVRDSWPALIAAVTDHAGIITGAHRTWLDPSGKAKAPISTPRRAMGSLLGNGVRFGKASDILAAGEGIETMLSLPRAAPGGAGPAGSRSVVACEGRDGRGRQLEGKPP